MDLNVVPIINENDTTSTEEIRFGDNDKLSAMITNALSAELLILLSDVDGLYTANPKKSTQAKLITDVTEINHDLEKYIDKDLSEFGSGGMLAKVNAAKLCMQSGSTMIIANGLVSHPLDNIIQNHQLGFILPKIFSLVVNNGFGIDLFTKPLFILMRGPLRHYKRIQVY